MTDDHISYMSGFNGYFETEAEKGALPKHQNSPKNPPLGLYAEQLTGSAFTSPRSHNLKTWLYRIKPSVAHENFMRYNQELWLTPPFICKTPPSPQQMRWDPLPYDEIHNLNLIESVKTWVGHGSPSSQNGAAVHLYAATKSMAKEVFYNSDAEMMFVPQDGGLILETEMGVLSIEPSYIAVIPRGVKFRVLLKDKKARGYLTENFGQPLCLPELGPIGANGLANHRDFEHPVAKYFNKSDEFKIIVKYRGHFWSCQTDHDPLNVVAWHGNYSPYRYNLKHFNTLGSISYDHPDPSIFTVLTSQTSTPGVANLDFVIFPPRWMVAEDTFRPPYYHRNLMSEYMGLISGSYDAKPSGFMPGGSSLHNCMSPHGPDKESFEIASKSTNLPEKYEDVLAFMFESYYDWRVTDYALNSNLYQKSYNDCWNGMESNFKK